MSINCASSTSIRVQHQKSDVAKKSDCHNADTKNFNLGMENPLQSKNSGKFMEPLGKVPKVGGFSMDKSNVAIASIYTLYNVNFEFSLK